MCVAAVAKQKLRPQKSSPVRYLDLHLGTSVYLLQPFFTHPSGSGLRSPYHAVCWRACIGGSPNSSGDIWVPRIRTGEYQVLGTDMYLFCEILSAGPPRHLQDGARYALVRGTVSKNHLLLSRYPCNASLFPCRIFRVTLKRRGCARLRTGVLPSTRAVCVSNLTHPTAVVSTFVSYLTMEQHPH